MNIWTALTAPQRLALLLAAASLLAMARGVARLVLSAARRRSAVQRTGDEHRRRVAAAMAGYEPSASETGLGWEGFRRFTVSGKEWETASQDVCSFYLEPEDGKTLPDFLPGQFLTFRMGLPDSAGQERHAVRCYSLSWGGERKPYRISVRRIDGAPDRGETPGVVSTHLHDRIQVGAVLNVKAPAGGFYLDPHKDGGTVVLISAGIGITPLFSMVDSLIESGSTRKIWFFVGMRSAHSFPLREQLLAWAKDRSGFNLVIFHSQPSADERLGVDFDVRGHLTAEAVRERLGQREADFYVCGPATMMNSMVGGLEALGIASDRIHFEAFGPASVRRAPKDVDDRIADPYSVRFARSGVSVSWDGTYDNLLSFAEAHGVPIDAGCRSGNCGTCATVVDEGTVEYVARVAAKTESGTCVTCVTVPSSALVLDA